MTARSSNNNGVWKWISGILCAVIFTGATMIWREDRLHENMRKSIEANTKANQDLAIAVERMNWTLQANGLSLENSRRGGRDE